MLEQCLLSLRCPQGSTSPVPQTRGEGAGQAAYSKTHRVRAAVLEVCALLIPCLFPAASHRSRTFLLLLVIVLINN